MRLYTSLWLRCEGKLIPSHDTYKLSDWSQQPIGITENIKRSHWKLKVKTGNRYEARENGVTESLLVWDLHLIGWKDGTSFFRPIKERSKANPTQLRIAWTVNFYTSYENRSFSEDITANLLDYETRSELLKKLWYCISEGITLDGINVNFPPSWDVKS